MCSCNLVIRIASYYGETPLLTSEGTQIWAVCNEGITEFYLPPTREPYLPLLPSRWSHTEINVPHQELNPVTVNHLSTNRPDLDNFVDRSQRANHYARPPPAVSSSSTVLCLVCPAGSCRSSVSVPVVVVAVYMMNNSDCFID